MKKGIFATFMVLILLLLGVSQVRAESDFLLTPATATVEKGQTFTAYVSLNPNNIKNYTAELVLKYPANLLQATSFTFGPNLLEVNQPGYDSIDNTNGVLTKTAGIPGGSSSPGVFGTIVFSAKANGTATLSVDPKSLAYDSNSSNQLSGFGSSTVIIVQGSASADKSTPTVAASVKPKKKAPQATPSAEVSVPQNENLNLLQNATTSSTSPELAAVQGADTSPTASNGVTRGLIIGIIGLAVLVALIYTFTRRSS